MWTLLITTHGIGPGCDLTLDVRKYPKEDKLPDVMGGILDRLRRAGILKKGGTVLADRGFFTIACLLVMISRGSRFITPATANSGIKRPSGSTRKERGRPSPNIRWAKAKTP